MYTIYPIMKIAGRLSNGGRVEARHARIVCVRMYAVGAVISAAMVSRVSGAHVSSNCATNFPLR